MARVKTYACPYCKFRSDRERLITHIAHKHEEMIPEGYTPRRVVFNYINKKDHGNCVICRKPTDWVEEAGHYDRFCSDKCREVARKQYLENIQKVKHTNNLMNDPEFQKKLLASRRISGTYKFRDGGIRSYTGSYEKNLLEFADKCLNIESKHIMTPGPSLEYSYNGEKHIWIIDQYWIPWNLLIEVKDGGANPNKREMPEYRTKQLCKEVMITDSGEYNYIRLTNNEFPQLIELLMEIKKENMTGDPKPVIKIYENTSINEMTHHLRKPFIDPRNQHGVYFDAKSYEYVSGATGEEKKWMINKHPQKDPNNQHGVYFFAYSIGSYVDDENIDGFALSNDILPSKILRVNRDGKLITESGDFLNDKKVSIFRYLGDKSIRDIITTKTVSDNYLYEALTGRKMFIKEQPLIDYEYFEPIDPASFKSINESYESTMWLDFNNVANKQFYFPMMSAYDIYIEGLLTNGYDNVCILEDIDGYFVYNKLLNQRSKSYESITEIGTGLVKQIAFTNIRESVYNDCTEFLFNHDGRECR